MDRLSALANLQANPEFDVIVIGGGATGLGTAVDAATRGFRTLLLEAKDFAKGTSSRATKLVHGGVRYLAQGDIHLVREALRERGRLQKNAPHLFRSQAFIIPGEQWWTGPYYTFGLWLYDRLAGSLSLGATKFLDANTAKQALPGVKEDLLKSGVRYFDGQFDDARLALTLAQTATEYGALVFNYFPVTGLVKEDNHVVGVTAVDELTGTSYSLKAKVVVNATGVFANDILAMDKPDDKPRIVPSQGIHLVFDREFLPGDNALMVPKTSDGRVLFALPWHDKLVVGTTDTLVNKIEYEPRPREEEINFILETAARYFKKAPTLQDVKAVFVGLRPLAAPEKAGQATKEVSRSHKIEVSESGLVNVFGGKWTTYRQMAEDVLTAATNAKLLPARPCKTVDLKLHGYLEKPFSADVNIVYGSQVDKLEQLVQDKPELATKLADGYDWQLAHVHYAVTNEAAVKIEDVLARRMRLLFIDAAAALKAAPAVAELMAQLLGWDQAHKQAELAAFTDLAKQYLMV